MNLSDRYCLNLITASAKKKFDCAAFDQQFPFDASFVITKLIADFTDLKPDKQIRHELHHEILKREYHWPKRSIMQFMKDKEHTFRREIAIALLADDMLAQGYTQSQVTNQVSVLCAVG